MNDSPILSNILVKNGSRDLELEQCAHSGSFIE